MCQGVISPNLFLSSIIDLVSMDELNYAVIGCAMKVHGTIGCGFSELVYARCMAIELDASRINFEQEKQIDIFYNGLWVGSQRADFLIEDSLIVELKARFELEKIHLIQTKNYLSAFDKPLGLLLNFGSASLEYKLVFKR